MPDALWKCDHPFTPNAPNVPRFVEKVSIESERLVVGKNGHSISAFLGKVDLNRLATKTRRQIIVIVVVIFNGNGIAVLIETTSVADDDGGRIFEPD